MGYNYSMHDKDPQAKAIVKKREERDRKLREKSEKKNNDISTKSKPIHETKYCKIWKRATIVIEEDRIAAIELITVKELNQEEVRFAYYKQEPNEKLRLILRPLDVTPEQLEKLFLKAREENIIK
ncbi:hypothetical protein [Halobacillus halophilus]|uniref:hypothetical protein n=1 Tax=Halobacillus halophilus TaxID=1570 RepID=UPI001CD4B473|nr:hypothetical protein [Halobacillus halophilus]MCA1010373.1 hypothetical protein [Halobacillus halophilus]